MRSGWQECLWTIMFVDSIVLSSESQEQVEGSLEMQEVGDGGGW